MNTEVEFYLYRYLDFTNLYKRKNPIKMSDFLSYLTVPYEKRPHWSGDRLSTLYVNEEHKLRINGVIISGVEYLNHITYKSGMEGGISNMVNPFYIFHILSDEGKRVVSSHYKEDLKKVVEQKVSEVQLKQTSLDKSKYILSLIEAEMETLTNH